MASATPHNARARAGFTLVEVALTVAVGLIILGGAVMGYNAVKDSAASANARRKVDLAGATVVEYAAANFGRYPTSVPGATGGEYSAMWVRKRPEDFNASPWGGQTGDTADGVIELAPVTDGTTDPATAPDKSGLLLTDDTQAANIIYVQIVGATYARFKPLSSSDLSLSKGFVISIHDRLGQPWFHLSTNK